VDDWTTVLSHGCPTGSTDSQTVLAVKAGQPNLCLLSILNTSQDQGGSLEFSAGGYVLYLKSTLLPRYYRPVTRILPVYAMVKSGTDSKYDLWSCFP